MSDGAKPYLVEILTGNAWVAFSPHKAEEHAIINADVVSRSRGVKARVVWEGRIVGGIMSNPCRTCRFAYLRTEKTKDWNYEACALGLIGMMPFLECSDCGAHEKVDEETIRIAAQYERRSTIIYGPDIEL